MLFSLRVAVPDRPGTLASLTALIASAGIDVRAVDVLGGRADEAVDHFLIEGEQEQMDGLQRSLRLTPGVSVLGLRRSGITKETNPDLDLVSAISREPHRALEVLTEATPRLLAADWALGFAPDNPEPRARTPWAPDVSWNGRQPLRSSRVMAHGSFTLPANVTAELVVAAVTGIGVVLAGRGEGPAFHDVEVFRLDKLMKTVESVLEAIVGVRV